MSSRVASTACSRASRSSRTKSPRRARARRRPKRARSRRRRPTARSSLRRDGLTPGDLRTLAIATRDALRFRDRRARRRRHDGKAGLAVAVSKDRVEARRVGGRARARRGEGTGRWHRQARRRRCRAAGRTSTRSTTRSSCCAAVSPRGGVSSPRPRTDGRVLGVDLGERRIGLALTDPSRRAGQPVRHARTRGRRAPTTTAPSSPPPPMPARPAS